MDVRGNDPAVGGFERVLALKDFSPPSRDLPIFRGPALVLLAEGEEDILVPASPTLNLLKDPEGRTLLFPRGKVKTVNSRRAGTRLPMPP